MLKQSTDTLSEGSRIARKAKRSRRWAFVPPWMRSLIVLAIRSLRRALNDNLWILSAGVAFYAFLSVFPAIAGTLMVWGLFSDPAEIRGQIDVLRGIAPPEAFDLIAGQMVRIADAEGAGSTIGAIVSLLFALWSASRAANALMFTLNVAYDVENPRGFVSSNLVAIRFTVIAIGFGILSLAAISAVPPVLEALRLGTVLDALLRSVRWGLLILVFFGMTTLAYRRTPSYRRTRKARLKTPTTMPGALVASAIWLTSSFGFSFYLSEFDTYNQTFGSLGAVAALLMWFWISAYAVGIGAEVNVVIDDRKAARLKSAPRLKAK